MFIYKNKVTNTEITTYGKINGGDWVFVREENPEAVPETKTKAKTKAKAKDDEKETDSE